MPIFSVRFGRNFQSSLKYALISRWRCSKNLNLMVGEPARLGFWALSTPKAWLMVAMEPDRSVNKVRAVAAGLAFRPGYTVLSSPFTVLLPAPRVARGVKFGSPK